MILPNLSKSIRQCHRLLCLYCLPIYCCTWHYLLFWYWDRLFNQLWLDDSGLLLPKIRLILRLEDLVVELERLNLLLVKFFHLTVVPRNGLSWTPTSDTDSLTLTFWRVLNLFRELNSLEPWMINLILRHIW